MKKIYDLIKKKIPARRLIATALAVCILFAVAFACPVSAYETTSLSATINVDTLNMRAGPGLSYEIIAVLTTGDVIGLTGQIVTADGYKWYETEALGWIAQTGGWTFNVTTTYGDTAYGYDAYGQTRWEHACAYTSTSHYYHFAVEETSYSVTCDCGWTITVYPEIYYNSSGVVTAQFLGLDTNNDELLDLYPGQTKSVLHSWLLDVREYEILEIYGAPETDTPTVKIVFATADHELIAEYTFEWYVDVRCETYGVVMEAMDGTTVTYPLSYDYLLYDRRNDFYLGDIPTRYKHGSLLGTSEERHVEYVFTLGEPGNVGDDFFSWVVYYTRSFGSWFTSLLTDFFGLGWIFTDSDSPFKYISGG